MSKCSRTSVPGPNPIRYNALNTTSDRANDRNTPTSSPTKAPTSAFQKEPFCPKSPCTLLAPAAAPRIVPLRRHRPITKKKTTIPVSGSPRIPDVDTMASSHPSNPSNAPPLNEPTRLPAILRRTILVLLITASSWFLGSLMGSVFHANHGAVLRPWSLFWEGTQARKGGRGALVWVSGHRGRIAMRPYMVAQGRAEGQSPSPFLILPPKEGDQRGLNPPLPGRQTQTPSRSLE